MKKLMAVFVLLLASALVFSLAAFSIDAAAAGELTVTGGTSGTDYDYSGDVLTIKRSTPITISGTTTTDKIVVDSTSGANITLSGVNVTSSTGAAFEIAESTKGTVTVTLEGSNRLTSGGNSAGLQKNGVTSKLLIDGNGGLTATSGNGGAAIGGASGKSSGNIEINSKGDASNKIKLITGGNGGAGIGGGYGGSGSNITISGGHIELGDFNLGVGSANNGSVDGACIGGGHSGSGSNITIAGGTLYLFSGGGGAAIGGGYNGEGKEINITGGDIPYAKSSTGAGIGGGQNADGYQIEISGGTFSNVVSANGGAGIGGGRYGSGRNITIKASIMVGGSDNGAAIGGGEGRNGEDITIEGDIDVTVHIGNNGAGIGGGSGGKGVNITIKGKAKVFADDNINGSNTLGALIGGGSGGNGEGIHIEGEAYVQAKILNGNGAAIGGGAGASGIDITIKDNATVIAEVGQNIFGAAIGGGFLPVGSGTSGDGKNITITGGTVTATTKGPGAGIGGSLGGSGTGITISGGKVKASSGGGAGIGSGAKAGTALPPIGENIVITDTAYVEAVSTGGAGIGGGANAEAKNIKISGGTVFALGTSTGIGGQNSDATVYIKGVSGTKYPWVFTNKITSSNYDGRYGTGNDGYLGIVFENASGNSFTDKENNNFNEGIVYGTSKTVEIMEDYTLKTGKKLTVPANVTFATKDMFTLDNSILYLKEEATLDKWYKMEIKGSGKIQHEDHSIYKWYGAEKYEFINATNYTELYSLNGSEGIVLCDICGKPEPHAAHINDKWEITSTHHWKLGTCDLGDDCAVTPFTSGVEKCSYMTAGNQLYYGLHRFGEPTKEADGLWHYICIDCLYEKTASDPITPTPKPTPTTRTGIIKIYKVDYADGSPLEGAKFGLYSDEECTSLIKSAVSEMDDDKAVVYFKVSAGDTYYVKEISAPIGYRLSGKVFRAKVSSNGTVTYSVVGTAGTSEDIPVCANVKATGNPGTAAGIGVAGIAAISGTVCIVSLAKKGRKKQP